MENKEKNATIIRQLESERDKLKGVRESLAATFNNEMNKDVVKLIRHAEHVVEDYIETLK